MTLLTTTTSAAAATCSLAGECTVPSAGAMSCLVTLLVESIFAAQCNISREDNWPKDYGETVLEQGLPDAYDYVVIGGGAAGSVVASRLSENEQVKVLLIEAGENPPLESEVPNMLSAVQGSNARYIYIAESNGLSCKSARNGQCGWITGKCLGGSGALNAMLYFRGTKADYDGWCAEGSLGWCYNDVWPYLEKSTKRQGNITHPRGYIPLNDYGRYDDDIFALFYKGSGELGVPRIKDFVEGSYIGYGNFRGTLENGRRVSTAKGFLSRVADKRPNLKIIKNAQVTKLNLNGAANRVDTIEFVLQEHTSLKVNVGREVIVAAGAVETPKLLMLSGIGPAIALNDVNIPVRHDLPVGENLQDHVAVPIFFRIPGRKTEQNLDDIYKYLMHQQGPLGSTGTGSLNGFIKLDKTSKSPYPDIQLQHFTVRRGAPWGMGFMGGFAGLEGLSTFFKDLIENYDVVVVFVILSQPKSRGRLLLRTSDYQDPLFIETGYLTAPEDVHVLRNGIRYLQQLENTTAFRKSSAKIAQVPVPNCPTDSDDFWRCYIEYFSSTSSHIVGTVKMGADDDSTACVNPRLQVKGVPNLRVADASIMPQITSCNTYGPTIMIGERAADFIKQDWEDL